MQSLSMKPISWVFQDANSAAEDSERGGHLESLRLSKHAGQIRLCHKQVGKSSHFTGWMMQPSIALILEPRQPALPLQALPEPLSGD